jgi:hypothetical protein
MNRQASKTSGSIRSVFSALSGDNFGDKLSNDADSMRGIFIIMDEGLREAIARSIPGAKRPLAIEGMIAAARKCQGFARHSPDAATAKRYMKLALKAGRGAVPYLRPGGEPRERLVSGELISEEDWERLCGPGRAFRRMKRPKKITFGEMRSSGVRGVLIYCADYKCSHSIAISADQWPDHVLLSARITLTLGIVIGPPRVHGRLASSQHSG